LFLLFSVIALKSFKKSIACDISIFFQNISYNV
jgi:hypothetical protein